MFLLLLLKTNNIDTALLKKVAEFSKKFQEKRQTLVYFQITVVVLLVAYFAVSRIVVRIRVVAVGIVEYIP